MQRSTIITPHDVDGAHSFTGGIQEAVDALPASGGTVFLPAGAYRLRRSVFMRPKVTVRGEGPATAVTRAKERVWTLAKTSRRNVYRFTLEHARGLKIGDQVCVCDDASAGWRSTHGFVKTMRGNTVTLDFIDALPHKPYKHMGGWAYSPERKARMTTGFPAFWILMANEVTVEDLTVRAPSPGPMSLPVNFVLSAVHANQSWDTRVTRVRVENWPSDGISIQGGGAAVVSHCVTEGCRGHGLHPGTSTRGGMWPHSVARGNHGDGYFFCLRVTDTTVRDCLLIENKGSGIANLTDPDRNNIVTGNICRDNGRHGIEARRAVGNVITGNICLGNSRSNPGVFSGIYLTDHVGNVVTGNVCSEPGSCSEPQEPTQTQGVMSIVPRGANVIKDNI